MEQQHIIESTIIEQQKHQSKLKWRTAHLHQYHAISLLYFLRLLLQPPRSTDQQPHIDPQCYSSHALNILQYQY